MTSPHRRAAPRFRRRAIPWQSLLGVLLIVAAAYLVGEQYRAGEEAQARGDCQARVNSELVEALKRRDLVNKQIAAAQRDVVATRVASPSESTRRDADRRYLAALDELDRIRQSNPIPAVPTC